VHWDESVRKGKGRDFGSVAVGVCDTGAGPGILTGRKCGEDRAVTMIELLCVIAIIGILASMLLPAIARTYDRIKGAAEEFEAPEIAFMLTRETRNYCAANPQYRFIDKTDFADKCRLAPKYRTWVGASTTEFVPFTFMDPTNLTVLSVHIGPRHRTLYSFTKGDLSIRPVER
jgi:prepilin-type N-terminal cleavage/methylation domain-containing protein